jgi:hypothetical protein
MNNWEESYEGIYGKGIMLITILTLIFYYFAGNHNISWDGLAEIKIWLLSGVFLFYIWHFKLVYDDNKNQITNGFYLILTYSIVNGLISIFFSAQYIIAFAMYQGLLINGYTGSVYYRGLTLLKEQIKEGKLQ